MLPHEIHNMIQDYININHPDTRLQEFYLEGSNVRVTTSGNISGWFNISILELLTFVYNKNKIQ